jgi:hypothetical protein
MFRLQTLSVLLSFVCVCLAEDDPGRVLEDARRLTAEGDYEGALAKHVWFHDNALNSGAGYYGVRLSFALTEWMKLGAKYPKALEKLKSIRDEKTQRLEHGKGTRALFHDVESINESLGQKSATVDLFKKLQAVDPKFGSMLFDIADEALLEAGEFELARKYMGDPAERLAIVRERYVDGLQSTGEGEQKEAARGAFERIFTGEVLRIIKVLSETGDNAGAKRIQEDALKTLSNDAIRRAVKDEGA